jgi:hypothetical protein
MSALFCPALTPIADAGRPRRIDELLVPELQRRAGFRREYKGSTLRENLFDDWGGRRR